MHWDTLRVFELVQLIMYVLMIGISIASVALAHQIDVRVRIIFAIFAAVKAVACIFMLIAHGITSSSFVVISFCLSTLSVGILQLMCFRFLNRGAKAPSGGRTPVMTRWSRVPYTIILGTSLLTCLGYAQLLSDNMRLAIPILKTTSVLYTIHIALILGLLGFWATQIPLRYCEECIPYLYATVVAAILFAIRVTFDLVALYGSMQIAGRFNLLNGPWAIVLSMVILPEICVVIVYTAAALHVCKQAKIKSSWDPAAKYRL